MKTVLTATVVPIAGHFLLSETSEAVVQAVREFG
jgi:hypothetical protein